MLLLLVIFGAAAAQSFSGFPPNSGFSNSIGGTGGFGGGFGGGVGGFRQWQRPCGLPHYIDSLPADMQYQVRAIWANYRPGENCDLQRQQSHQLFWSLPQETRQQMWQGMHQHWQQRWMNRPCHLPRMMNMLPANLQQQVMGIWRNWREGQTCEQERSATHQLFMSLPQDQKMQMWQGMRQAWQIRMGQFGGMSGGMAGGTASGFQ